MERNDAYGDAKVCIIPVPYEGTVCFRKGTKNGPAALLRASYEVEDYDIELEREVVEEGFHVMDPLKMADGERPENVVGMVRNAVSKVRTDGKIPVVIGGEHSVSVGAVQAFEGEGISVLQIDAHSDLRDEFEGSRYSHACAARRMREIADSVAQVGVRSATRECFEYLDSIGKKDTLFLERDYDISEILDILGERVYITVDMDGFDSSLVPAVGTPQPGGLLWHDVLDICRAVGKEKEIAGFDVVELAPIADNPASDLIAAKLLYKLAGYALFPEEL
ncbi:MAG TPA: agmatinase [Candidatus Bilamarchaeaceae archaeon]|nr:agmatinase [Candidatus Bilamarchaeaceae archaeon]